MADATELKMNMKFRALPGIFYNNLGLSKFPSPDLFAYNETLGVELGLPEGFSERSRSRILAGVEPFESEIPIAMAYSGHQFGHWSGVLGDGRARLIGEVISKDNSPRELHLKGAGRTPYSRGGDGKATLGSAIREYLVSEAMAALGVPTSRSLSIVTTGESIQRQVAEPGAVLCRSAKSHIRVGSFQFAAANGTPSDLKALAEFAIERFYPDAPESGEGRYIFFLRETALKQADLVAQWMALGFIHGVMNTDNMCISGETLDYGPCAFMDEFHPSKVFSSIDRHGRYAWNKQPEMAQWNLARLAESLLPLLGVDEDAQIKAAEGVLADYAARFKNSFNERIAAKFGLLSMLDDVERFSGETFKVMAANRVDYTLFFRCLTDIADGHDDKDFLAQFDDAEQGQVWLTDWKGHAGFTKRLKSEAVQDMRAANPYVIPRNHRVEAAIEAAYSGDKSVFEETLEAFSQPFDDKLPFEVYERAPEPDEVVQQTFCGT